MPAAEGTLKNVASNRRALRDYHVLQRLEAGVALQGTEVKALRSGSASLVGSYARVEDGEVWAHNVNIPPYEFGNRFNHDVTRPRRLLLHRREIRHLQTDTEQKGCALIPLRLYFLRGRVKLELGVCKGKRSADKRETLRRRTMEREAQRAVARHRSKNPA
jgi:SsrA-binding protein